MATFTADLPDTKTETGATVEFLRAEGVQVPAAGLLRIVQRRCTCTYAVVERKTDWPGRSFLLAKAEGDLGSDSTEERYSVFVGGKCWCECKGFHYSKAENPTCKHIEAMRVLVESGQI